jgi:exonuclease III
MKAALRPGFENASLHAWVYTEERFSDHAPLVMDYDFDLMSA